MSEAEIDAFHQQMVVVLDHSGMPISFGRITVLRAAGMGPRRVCLDFETEATSCSLGISLEELRTLRDTFDGGWYRHRLPEEKVWLTPAAQSAAPIATRPGESPDAAKLVETFPLPPNARLIGYSADTSTKRKA